MSPCPLKEKIKRFLMRQKTQISHEEKCHINKVRILTIIITRDTSGDLSSKSDMTGLGSQ